MEFQFSLEQLPSIVQKFWDCHPEEKVFAFHGEMGAGKTTIISALCHARGTKDVTGSPTFSIINEYGLPEGEKIFHIDLYRLKNEEEVISAGVEDCIYSGSICMVEWPEKAPHLFDSSAKHVYIEIVSENKRKLTIRNQ